MLQAGNVALKEFRSWLT